MLVAFSRSYKSIQSGPGKGEITLNYRRKVRLKRRTNYGKCNAFWCPGNGYITTEVLREILSELDNNMSDDELDQMIDEIDADGSGTVDFDGKWFSPVLIRSRSRPSARNIRR